jgi:hypothetical protein
MSFHLEFKKIPDEEKIGHFKPLLKSKTIRKTDEE